ncbi:MAG: hypothetical protein JNJ94_12490 [Chlorobi bacterium]|nr:hypothetical protein [Chlorobiota bacterium]
MNSSSVTSLFSSVLFARFYSFLFCQGQLVVWVFPPIAPQQQGNPCVLGWFLILPLSSSPICVVCERYSFLAKKFPAHYCHFFSWQSWFVFLEVLKEDFLLAVKTKSPPSYFFEGGLPVQY